MKDGGTSNIQRQVVCKKYSLQKGDPMKKIIHSLVFAWIISLLTATAVLALIINGGFETGDFTGWTKSAFINTGLGQSPGVGGSDLSAIVGGPAVVPMGLSDPNTGGNLKYPAAGHYSVRVNSELAHDLVGNGMNANTISQTVSAILDPSDGQVHVRFRFAAVMAHPVYNPHPAESLPYFRVQAINTSNGDDVLFDYSTYVGKPGETWLDGVTFGNQPGDYWQYLDWATVDIASSAAHPVKSGDMISLKITAAGCAWGGHPAYAYIDEVTDVPPPVTLSITATGAATVKPGDQYTYTLNYTTDTSISNAQINLTLPGHTTFVSSDKSCSAAGGVVTCNLGAVDAGGGSFDVTVLVDRLKKISLPLTLPTTSYSMSASGATTVNGLDPVIADVLTPFADVPEGYWALDFIQSLWAAGITSGCSQNPMRYCPDDFEMRGEAAVMIERGMGNFAPSPSPTGMFTDIPYPGLESYTPFIEEFYNDGITSGCSLNPLMYCPRSFITRGQAAVMIERAMGNFSPSPFPTGMFADVPYPGLEGFTRFIEESYNDGITSGCAVNPLRFCPQSNVTRGAMAVFIQRAFSLPMPS